MGMKMVEHKEVQDLRNHGRERSIQMLLVGSNWNEILHRGLVER